MRRMEPALLHMMKDTAQSTTDIIKALYGEDYPTVEKARVQVHEALACLEKDGKIESRIIPAGPSQPSQRYWALPGGSFPDNGVSPLTERVLSCLQTGPKQTDEIYEEVYTDMVINDPTNARKNLSKSLNNLRRRGAVERTTGDGGIAWRLSE